jgi:hypothetical protein
MTRATGSFVSFVDGLDPDENNAKGSMRSVFTPEPYSDLSAEVGSLPDALARAIAASDTDTMTHIADVLSDLAGEYEGHLELGLHPTGCARAPDTPLLDSGQVRACSSVSPPLAPSCLSSVVRGDRDDMLDSA